MRMKKDPGLTVSRLLDGKHELDSCCCCCRSPGALLQSHVYLHVDSHRRLPLVPRCAQLVTSCVSLLWLSSLAPRLGKRAFNQASDLTLSLSLSLSPSFLLSLSSLIACPRQSGFTPLHLASSEGHVEIVNLLLRSGALIDSQDELQGNTPLHEAAWKGFRQTAEVLMKHKANPYIKNKSGFSALHLACQQGHNGSARVLLMSRCKPDLKNNYGDTPLHTAARYGHAGVARILISAFCDVSQVNKNGDTALHITAGQCLPLLLLLHCTAAAPLPFPSPLVLLSSRDTFALHASLCVSHLNGLPLPPVFAPPSSLCGFPAAPLRRLPASRGS